MVRYSIAFQVRVWWKWRWQVLFCPPIRWLIIKRSWRMMVCTSWWLPGVTVASCWDFKQLFPPMWGHAAWKQIGTQFSSSGFRSWKGQGPGRRTEFWHCLMRSEQSHLCLIFPSSFKATATPRAQMRLAHFSSSSSGSLHFAVWIHSAGNPGVWLNQYT